MKNIKKLLAFALVLVMLSALSVTVFAAQTYTITINNTPSTSGVSIIEKTFKAYKVFDMTYDDTVTPAAYAYTIDSDGDGAWCWSTLISGLTADSSGVYTNTTYGLKFTPTAADPTIYVVTQTGTSGMTDAQARAMADDLGNAGLPTTDQGHATATTESVTINIDPDVAGYYAVYGEAADAGGSTIVASLALDSTDATAEINLKASAPPFTKQIATSPDEAYDLLDAAGKAAVAEVGTTINYEVTSAVPDLTSYDDYTFIVTDTMSSGLTWQQDSLKVYIKNTTTPLAASKYSLTVGGASDSFTFKVQIPYSTLSDTAYAAGDDILITYSAIVNGTSLSYDYEHNTANLEYSRSPYDDNTNHTPDQHTYVIDLNLDVLKVDESNSATKLDGAKFKLYKITDSTTDPVTKAYYKWDATNKTIAWQTTLAAGDEFVTGTDGKLTQQIRGLGSGTYYLQETAAPEGYNQLTHDIPVEITITEDTTTTPPTVTVTATYDGEDATIENGTIQLVTPHTTAQPTATGTIGNNAGTVLPSTGGIGTTLFYVIGAILVIGAGVVLVTKRRVRE